MLFLASVAGQIGSQTDPPYSASKAALINFAQCAAKDLAPYGVRVNTLCPGMVQDGAEPLGLAGLARPAAGGAAAVAYEEWAGEKIRTRGAAGPLADAGGRGGDGRVPGLAARPRTSPGRRSTSTAGS